MERKKLGLNDLRLCVDRVVKTEHAMDAAVLAMNENNSNEPPPLIMRPGAPVHPLEMALATPKRWNNGRKLKIKFLDGTSTQKRLTQKYAEHWLQFANVGFDFNGGASAEIRISFRKAGSWSALGTDSLLTNAFPKTDPTMNYGWLRDSTPEEEWRRVVLHEFGHALSAIHEHQNPQAGIKWNLNEVYRVFSGPPNNWSKAQIDFNIVQKYSVDQLNATDFDAKSIMLYAFPGKLIASGKATANNTDLSDNDKRFIAEMYPKAAPAPATLEIGAPEALAAPRPPREYGAAHFRKAAAHLQKLRAR
ncbi:MAG: hypothetical protein DMF56_01960 [Acidobacteria bacterium]|nr:MAG: hypothetical protein DMF56_01960 [Acidobacteriota bacterium]